MDATAKQTWQMSERFAKFNEVFVAPSRHGFGANTPG